MVADNVQAAFGAGDGDIQQIGSIPREPARAGLIRVAAEDEDDRGVRFLPGAGPGLSPERALAVSA
jgi:hypothetical protein